MEETRVPPASGPTKPTSPSTSDRIRDVTSPGRGLILTGAPRPAPKTTEPETTEPETTEEEEQDAGA